MSLSTGSSRDSGSSQKPSPVGSLRVDVDPPTLDIKAGEPAVFVVEVANSDAVIRQIGFGVLGFDRSWVTFEPAVVTLFPEERGFSVVTVTVPEGFPSGGHDVAVEVTDLAEPLSPVVAHAVVTVAANNVISVKVDPPSIDTATHGQYTGTVVNKGNSTLEVTFAVVDPEGLTQSSFAPASLRLGPGAEGITRIDVKGNRPWFGASALRFLTIEANGRLPDVESSSAEASTAEASTAEGLAVEGPAVGDPVVTDVAMVTISHRARIARRSLTLLGLLLAATTFAMVFSLSFGKVAEKTKASEALLKKSLSGSSDGGGGGAASPTGIGGIVASATGAGIDGATVDLFDTARGPLLALRTTVTDQTGAFRFPGLQPAVYKVRVTAAGFGERWFPQAFGYDESQDIVVEAGATVADLSMVLAGQPASIGGVVLGDRLDGGIVTVRLPASALPTTGGEPTPTEVRTLAIGEGGVFEMTDLPAPATYEVSASAPGLASQPRTIVVQPGQRVDKVTLLLRPGAGVVTGRVVDFTGQPVSGATVVLVSGTARYETITLSGDPTTAGQFEIRDLAVPATVSLSVASVGYLTASETVELSEQTPRLDRPVTLLPASAALGGTVRGSDGVPLGGISVTVSGGDFKRTTATISQGASGRWLITGVPAPGEYTITFSADQFVALTQAVGVAAGSVGRTDIDVTISSAVASVKGVVRELGSATDATLCVPTDSNLADCPGRLGGVSVVLTATGLERKTFTAHIPTGNFQLDEIPPGPYTITFSRIGSTPQTLFVELSAAQNLTIADVYLEPQARITGTVTRGALAVSNVGVKIYKAAQYPLVPAATTFTNAVGQYSVIGLVAPETYIIEFQYPAGGQIVASQQVFLRPGVVVDGSQTI